jgi:hypothetical protein
MTPIDWPLAPPAHARPQTKQKNQKKDKQTRTDERAQPAARAVTPPRRLLLAPKGPLQPLRGGWRGTSAKKSEATAAMPMRTSPTATWRFSAVQPD